MPDHKSRPKQQRPSRVSTVVVLVLLGGLGVFLFRPVLPLIGGSKTIAPAEAAESVADYLLQWGVPGPVPDRNPDYTNLKNSIAARMTGIRGFTESDGFHGDGSDWYEVELPPDLAAEIRAGLAQSTAVKKSKSFPPRDSAPSWWPRTWPTDAQCYERDLQFDLQYLVLTDTGTRAWFVRVRM